MKPRPVRLSIVEMTQMVLPPDTNPIGTAFGGQVVAWVDVCAAIAATRHAHTTVVTAAIDELHFLAPVRLGDVVVLKASVNAVFRTSMEVGVRVEREDPLTGLRAHTASAFLTFVAVDRRGRPRRVPAILPETPQDHRRQVAALARRTHRLEFRRALARRHLQDD